MKRLPAWMTSSSRRSTTTRSPRDRGRPAGAARRTAPTARGRARPARRRRAARGSPSTSAPCEHLVDQLHHQLVVGDAEVTEAAEPGAAVHEEVQQRPALSASGRPRARSRRGRPGRRRASAPRDTSGKARRRRSGRRRRGRRTARAGVDDVVVGQPPLRSVSLWWWSKTRCAAGAYGRLVRMSRSVTSTTPSCTSLGCTKVISSIMPSSCSRTAHTSPSKSLRVTSRYCVTSTTPWPGDVRPPVPGRRHAGEARHPGG